MRLPQLMGIALVTSSLLVLGACEDASKKAQRKYERSIALVESGDTERALVELRGVFDLDSENLEARLLYADLMMESGKLREAFSHYLLVTEQHPQDERARIIVAKHLMQAGEWSDMQRQLDAAAAIVPDNLEVQALQLAVEFRDVARKADTADIQRVNDKAEALLELDPSLEVARTVLIDTKVNLGDMYGAIDVLDAGLEVDPTDQRFNEFKLRLLDRVGDTEGIGAQLRLMTERFPEEPSYKLYLVQWFLRNDDIASADEFLLGEIERNGDEIPPRVTYIQFLLQVRGVDATIEKLDAFIEEGLDDALFRMLRASTQFDNGQTDEAITNMRALLAGQEPSDKTRDMKTTLARMLIATGEDDEANLLIDAVLEEDPRHVAALKFQADRFIEEDRVSDAILSLRTGLDQAPQDPELYSLLAKAHERDGNRDLMGENLSMAVQQSNGAVEESIRYARFLMSDEKYPTARDIILQSLRRHPVQLELLRVLSEIYVGMADWPRTEQVIKALRSVGTEQSIVLANGLEATVLQRMQRTDESLSLLRGMLNDESTALVAQAAIVRTHLAEGQVETARKFMDDVLAETPDSEGALFLNAALLSVEGKNNEATAIYRTLLEKSPKEEVIWRAYIASLARDGDMNASYTALDNALAELPDSMNLLWLKASYEENLRNFEAAIEIYQQLYERESSSTIVANNLASLISTYRDTDEDLRRAYTIARRLRDTEIPAFQDTYGWIAYRMGDVTEAAEYLEGAAQGLPNDPLVQEHYAHALASTNRPEEAAGQFRKVLDMLPADATETRARVEAEIKRLELAPSGN